MLGPCAKTRVQCTIVAPDGRYWVGENLCAHPRAVCPRACGEGYEKCDWVCGQIGHAEEVAAALAEDAAGGVAYLEGHTYVCERCMRALRAIGVERVVIGAPGAEPDERDVIVADEAYKE